MEHSLRIVFMGTPDFAVPSLEVLHHSQHEVVGVVTAPDRPAGRGRKERPSAVKQKALELRLNILQPEKLKAPEFIDQLQTVNADLFIVVAFRMLPEVVWSMPKKGCINLHASLLPDLRGAAPINWALLYGYERTGVTTFFIEKEIDTGLVIEQKEVEIAANDNVGTLHDKLMDAGAALLLDTVNAVACGEIKTVPQGEMRKGTERDAPKIHKEDGRLDWNQPAEQILGRIRGFSPYPGAWTKLNTPNGTRTLKIFSAIASAEENLGAGQIRIIGNGSLLVGTTTLPLDILELQLEGKKRMHTGHFLMGAQHIELWTISEE